MLLIILINLFFQQLFCQRYNPNQSFLKCSNCGAFCHPPFHLCKQSHLFCENCSLKRSLCVHCKSDISEVESENMEILHNTMYFPCENSDNGCLTYSWGFEILQHQEMCQYKMVDCPVRKCNEKIFVADFILHFMDVHPNFLFSDQVLPLGRIFFTELTPEAIVMKNIITDFNMLFLIRIYVSFTGNFMRFSATNIGPIIGEDEYEALVLFKQNNDQFWEFVVDIQFSKKSHNVDSQFVRKNISSLRMQEDFYFDHDIFIRRKHFKSIDS